MTASENCKKHHSSTGINPSRKCLEFMIRDSAFQLVELFLMN